MWGHILLMRSGRSRQQYVTVVSVGGPSIKHEPCTFMACGQTKRQKTIYGYWFMDMLLIARYGDRLYHVIS